MERKMRYEESRRRELRQTPRLLARRSSAGLLLCLLLLFATAGPVRAQPECAPTGMIRIETVNISPGLSGHGFATRPKVLYRAGSLRIRIEEAPDPEQGLHLLAVISAPDVWFVNLATKTGRHIVDPDPTPGAHAPVLVGELPSNFPDDFRNLEFGCENEFFASRQAKQIPHEAAGRKLTKHVLTHRKWRLTLVTGADDPSPQALLLSRRNKVVFALRYMSYMHSDQVDQELFTRPEGTQFTEAN